MENDDIQSQNKDSMSTDNGPVDVMRVTEPGVSRDLVPVRLLDGAAETLRGQAETLQFRDIFLEAKYAIYTNKLSESKDTSWTLAFAVIFAVLAFFPGAKYPVKEWMPFFLGRLTAHALNRWYPRFWLRYREMFWVAERLNVFLQCSLPGTPTIMMSKNHRFAYGNFLLVSTAFVSQVRFHVQICFSVIVTAVSYFLMAINARSGSFVPTPLFMLSHTISTILPCVVIFVLDRRSRAGFLGKFATRQLDWMKQLF